MAKKKKEIDRTKFTKIELSGLRGKYGTFSAGDVVYSRYGGEWRIYVPKVYASGTDGIVQATFASGLIYNNIIEGLKKLARPYSAITDRNNNNRPLIGKMTIFVDENGTIHDYEVNGAEEWTSEKLKERASILEANPTYAMFFSKPDSN